LKQVGLSTDENILLCSNQTVAGLKHQSLS